MTTWILNAFSGVIAVRDQSSQMTATGTHGDGRTEYQQAACSHGPNMAPRRQGCRECKIAKGFLHYVGFSTCNGQARINLEAVPVPSQRDWQGRAGAGRPGSR